MSTTSTTSSTSSSTSSLTSTSSSGSPISAGPLDVQSLVSSLMTTYQTPLNNLKSQATGVQSQISAYGQIQSSLSSLESAAQKLMLPSSFQAATATVSGTGVTANVTGTPAAGTYSVNVSQLAQTQAVASTAQPSSSAAVGTGTLTIQLGSYNSTGNTFTPASGSSAVSINIDSSDNSLDGIAAAINNAGAGVTATVVNDTSGARLLLTSTSSGAANGFEITTTDSDGNDTDNSGLSQLAYNPTAASGSGQNMQLTQTAQDAKYTVNGLSLTSASNAVTGVVNGLTINLTQAPPAGSAAGTTVNNTITVAQDTSTIASTVNNFVTAYNSFQSLVATDTAYNTSTNTASVLTGDSTLKLIGSQITQMLSSTVGGSGNTGLNNLAQIGIQFQSDGTLKFDSTDFSNAMSSNPKGVQALFATATGSASSQGIGVQLNNALSQMLLPNGAVTSRTKALQTQLTSIQSQETDQQNYLTQIQNQLTTQYSALNAALASMQQQQSQLTSMLNGLS